MTIQQLSSGQPLPIALLLKAEPDEAKVLACCQSGQIWVMGESTVIRATVLHQKPDDMLTAKIKNIAIQPGLRKKGLGQPLLSFIIEEARRQGVSHLLVATGNSSIGQLAFYQKASFEMLHLDRHYFTEHYAGSIIKNGTPCRHRVVLELNTL